ncbi:hypothetical protein [Actinokineospora globicatena]|uniref:hypothetical protein n=1 Tax=Actinokineospora globicatena TaxID=103729 RepID=UPI0020A535AB|nr:hypothetical protein [Actinokineospora globicatena]MCP2304775.1 hypothetical protein [Actinokineospora globicatena]GLW77849.1 hypothetical protein Aglo01_23310 [Actinokineospora globicatena]GLW85483.1 hypothetical protein Aglo02_31230 [Actinokineospora globicatena]
MPEPDPRERLARQLHESDDLPAGPAKCEALERVARAADAAGLPDLGVASRLVLVNAYREIRRYDLMLTPFAWLRATETRHPEAFDEWAVHQFTWMHKWLATGLLGDPRFTLDQITALVDQLEQRYRLHGYSLHPVHDKRRALAHHVGDTEAADTHFTAWRGAEPDDMSDCPACVVDSQVGYFVSRERFTEAIAVARPVLDEPSDCAEQPHGVLASLIEAYLATGRLEDAARAHLVSYRVVRGTPQGRSALHAHLRFCAITDNAGRGLEILTDNIDVLTDPPSPKVLLEFAAAAALVLSRVPDRADRRFTLGEVELDGEALRVFCAEEALTTAVAFDQRNGTDAVSGRVRATLDLADVGPVLVAVPPAAQAEQVGSFTGELDTAVLGEPRDQVDAAEAACAAIEAGQALTGVRLLADVSAVGLPDGLAARVAAHRQRFQRIDDPAVTAARLVECQSRLLAAGELVIAARLHHVLAGLWQHAGQTARANDHARLAVAEGTTLGDALAVIYGHLALVDLDPVTGAASLDTAEEVATAAAPQFLGAVRDVRAELLAASGDVPGALAIVAGLLDGVSTWPELTTLRLMDHRARLLADLGRIEESAHWFDQLVARCRKSPGPWLADSLMQYAVLIDHAGLAAENLPTLLEAAAAARAYLPPVGTAQACLHLSAGYLATGRALEAAETLEEALRLTPPTATDLLTKVHYRLALACRDLDEHATAETHLTAVIDAGTTDDALLGHLLHQLGDVRLHLGALPDAATAFEHSAAHWRAADNPIAASESLVRLAHARGMADLTAGLSYLDEAETLAASTEDGLDQLAETIGFRVALLAHHEHYAQALTANAAAEELAVRLGNPDWQAFLAGRAAHLHLDIGDPDTAESEARRAAALLGTPPNPQTLGVVLGTLARTLEEQGKPVDSDPLVKSLTTHLD